MNGRRLAWDRSDIQYVFQRCAADLTDESDSHSRYTDGERFEEPRPAPAREHGEIEALARKSQGTKTSRRRPAESRRDSGTAIDDSFADRAYKELERQIVTAQIRPGSWVTEIALSEQLGISRTPVRQALQRLARARLIEIVPRRGLRITEVNASDQLLLLEFRREAERYLVGRAADWADDHGRSRFQALAVEMERAGTASDVAEHYRVDLEYKLLLVKAARNDYAGDAIAPMWALSRRFAWVTRFERDIGRMSSLTAKVMSAIAKGDRELARACNDAYIDGLVDLARRSLELHLGSSAARSGIAPM